MTSVLGVQGAVAYDLDVTFLIATVAFRGSRREEAGAEVH